MKKFLVLAIFIMGFLVAPIAQKLLPEEYAIEYTGVVKDTIVDGTPWVKTISINKGDAVWYSFAIKVGDQTANAQCTVVEEGRLFSFTPYATLNTKRWYGTGTDSIINFASTTNKIFYRDLRYTVTQNVNKAKVLKFGLSLKE